MSTQELCRAYVAARDALWVRRQRLERVLLSLDVAVSMDLEGFAALDSSARERELHICRAIAERVDRRLEGEL